MKKTDVVKLVFIIIGAVLFLVGIAFLIAGNATSNRIETLIGEGTITLSLTISITINFTITISNISLSKTINKYETDIVELKKEIIQINSSIQSINNGIQTGGDFIYQAAKEQKINDDEIKHFEFIKSNMDIFVGKLTCVFSDILNVYTSYGVNADGIPTRGDYEEMAQVLHYLQKPSTVFANENLRNSSQRLKDALAQLDWDLFLYTKQYNEDLKSHDMWSLWYLIAEHPSIFSKIYGELTSEIEQKSEEELHLLQDDRRKVEDAYKEFIETYNGLR